MNFCTVLLGLLMLFLINEDLCRVNGNHLSGNSNRTLTRAGTGGRLGTSRRTDRLATSRRTIGTDTLRRTASGRVITSRRNVGTTNARTGTSNTRAGVANTRTGTTNTRTGTTNTRVGPANTRFGISNSRGAAPNTLTQQNTRVQQSIRAQSNTRAQPNTRIQPNARARVGVASTQGRGMTGTAPNALENARVILTPVQQGAVRSMRNLLQNGRSTTGRGGNPRLIGFLIPRPDGRTQLQLMPDARRFLGGDNRRFNGRVTARVQRNNTLPLNLRTIINAARRANLLPRPQAGRGSTRPPVAREQSIVVLRPRDGETGGLLQEPETLRSNSVRNQILDERRNALRNDNINRMDRLDRFTTNRPLDRDFMARSRQSIASQSTNPIDQSNGMTNIDQSGSGRRAIAVTRDRNPISSGVDQFTNQGPDPNQFVANNSPDVSANNAFVDTATPPLQDRTLFLPSSVNDINRLDTQITPAPLPLENNINPPQQVIAGQTAAPQNPIQTNGGSTSTVFQAASGSQSLPVVNSANMQMTDTMTGSQTGTALFDQSAVTGTTANMQTNVQTDMPPIQATTSIQSGFDTSASIQTNIQTGPTPPSGFGTPVSTQIDTTQTSTLTTSAQQTAFDSSSMQTNNMMPAGLTSTSIFDSPTSLQTDMTQILTQTPSPRPAFVDTSATLQTNNVLPTDFTTGPVFDAPTNTQTGMSQILPETVQIGQGGVESTPSTGLAQFPVQGNILEVMSQSVQPQNNIDFPQQLTNVVDSTMSLPPPILPASAIPTNFNSQAEQNIPGQVDQSTLNAINLGGVASNTNDIMPKTQASSQQSINKVNGQFDQNLSTNNATFNTVTNQLPVNNLSITQSQPASNNVVNSMVALETQANTLTSVIDQGASQTPAGTLPVIENSANLGQFRSSVINNAIDVKQTQQGQTTTNTQAKSPGVGSIVPQNGNDAQINIQNQILDQNLLQGQGVISNINNGFTSPNEVGISNVILAETQSAAAASNANQNLNQRTFLDTNVVTNELQRGQTNISSSVQNTIQGTSNMRNPNFITIEITGNTKQQGMAIGQTGVQNANVANIQNAVQTNAQSNAMLTDPILSQAYAPLPGSSTGIRSNSPTITFPPQPAIQNNIISNFDRNMNKTIATSIVGEQTIVNSNSNLTPNIIMTKVNQGTGTITEIASNIPSNQGTATITEIASNIPSSQGIGSITEIASNIPANQGIGSITEMASNIPANQGIGSITEMASNIPANQGIGSITEMASNIPANQGIGSITEMALNIPANQGIGTITEMASNIPLSQGIGSITEMASNIPANPLITETNFQNVINDIYLNQAQSTGVSGGQNILQNTNLLSNTISSQMINQNPVADLSTGIMSNQTSVQNGMGNANLNVNQERVISVVATAPPQTVVPVQPAQSVPSSVFTQIDSLTLSSGSMPPPIVPSISNTNSKTTVETSNTNAASHSATRIIGIQSQRLGPNSAPVETQGATKSSSTNLSIQNSATFTPQAPSVPMDLPTLKTTPEVLNVNTVSVDRSASSGNGTLSTNTINAIRETIPSQSLAVGVSSPEQLAGLPVEVAPSLPNIVVATDANITAETPMNQPPTITETTKPVVGHAATAFKTASTITDVVMPTAAVKGLIQTSLNTSGLVERLNQISNTSTKTEVLSAAGGLVDSALSNVNATLGQEPVQAIFTTSPQAPEVPKESNLDFPPPPPFAVTSVSTSNQTNELTRQRGGPALDSPVGVDGISESLQNDLRQMIRESRRRFNTNLIRAISSKIRNESRDSRLQQNNEALPSDVADSIVERPRPRANPNGRSPFVVDVNAINPFAVTTKPPPTPDRQNQESPFRSSFSFLQRGFNSRSNAGGLPVFLPMPSDPPRPL